MSDDFDEIGRAVETLRAGGLVAFPTETVYGLGADARQREAILRVFQAKGRPATNPLIVHVASAAVARRYTTGWDGRCDALAAAFWPGPLTMVLPRTADIVSEAAAGLSSVGLRVPDHPLTLELLERFDGPVAGPSANRSTRVSPTSADHVRRSLGDRVDLILDGGTCRVGIESTVLSLTGPRPRLLRPGAITRAMIEATIGPVEVLDAAATLASETAPASPGLHPVHYAPVTRTWRFDTGEFDRVIAWLGEHPSTAAVLLLTRPETKLPPTGSHCGVTLSADPSDYARALYGALHQADDGRADLILVEMPPDRPEWFAVRDRLFRASTPFKEK